MSRYVANPALLRKLQAKVFWPQVLSQVVEVLSATAKQHGAAWVPTIQTTLLPLVDASIAFLTFLVCLVTPELQWAGRPNAGREGHVGTEAGSAPHPR